jgi:cold shock CspA family protein
MIVRDDTGDEIFFHFTAIPGAGYRTIRAGTPVVFEVVDNPTGPTARNVQQQR